jgi:hypothetical protein
MKRRNDPIIPRGRTERLVVEELPDEVLVYDLDRHRAHCLNRLATAVWKHCDGKRTVSQMARLLEAETKGPVTEEIVWLALDQLGKFRLLEERLMRPPEMGRVSRRDLVQKYLPAALSLPLIMSIAAPAAAQAVTCGAVGTFCTTNARCCTNLCINNTCACLGNCSNCTQDSQCCSNRCGSAQNKCLPCGT